VKDAPPPPVRCKRDPSPVERHPTGDPEHACGHCASVVPNRAALRRKGIGVKPAPRHRRAGMKPQNARTHIGRPVLDPDGNPAWERVPSIHGKGHYRVRYEYVPIFADPEMTARVMVRAATRKAVLDAKRARREARRAAT